MDWDQKPVEPFVIEEWKNLRYYPGYAISNTGKVKHKTSGNIQKRTYTPNGYAIIQLSADESDIIKIHQEVFETFGELPEKYDSKKYYMEFKDNDKSNCLVTNIIPKKKTNTTTGIRILVRDPIDNSKQWFTNYVDAAGFVKCSKNTIKKKAELKEDFFCNGYWVNFR